MAKTLDTAILRALGEGTPIDDVCAAGGLDRAAFDDAWAAESARRLPRTTGTCHVTGLEGRVEILRDGRGLPHIRATCDTDLFLGYGYAMAQDRLFQMDLRRRRGLGRLAEVLGMDGLEADRTARTMGHQIVAEEEAAALDAQTRRLLEAFGAGVDAHVRDARDALPIEFDLLGYRPDPWTVLSSVACAMSWRWQLTGRPWVIAVPEVVKRAMGDGPLYRRFLDAQREADHISIVSRGSYPTQRQGVDPLPADLLAQRGAPAASLAAAGAGGPSRGASGRADRLAGMPAGGSNDWVVAGSRSRSGRPLVASDPHMPYESSSSFYEVHLQGGSFDVVGAGFVGLPGITIGRNPDIAWGFTNNICSMRDLYAELVDPDDPGAFLYDGRSEPALERHETISVAGGGSVELTVRSSRHGPIVDDLLPPAMAGTGPVSMRWAGSLPCDWIAAQLRLDRATSVPDAMVASRGWRAPTFSLVMGDRAGHIGYLATGAIPIREVRERGYRPGHDPAHAWTGSIPYAGMPRAVDPTAGYIVTANNRPAPDDFPYPLSGTWDEGLRAQRIGRLIEDGTPHDIRSMGRIQLDQTGLRVDRTRDPLVARLKADGTSRSPIDAAVLEALEAWDGVLDAGSTGAAVYEVLMGRWTQAVIAERLGWEHATFLGTWGAGLASSLLTEDDAGWFAPGRRDALLAETFRAAVEELVAALGPDVAAWRWGALHRMRLRHPLGGRGDLGELLDKPAFEVGGDSWTINNSGVAATRPGADGSSGWEATGGAGFRMIVDLGETPPRAWTITAEGQSGHAGSPHAHDQFDDHLHGRYRAVPMDPAGVDRAAVTSMELVPDGR